MYGQACKKTARFFVVKGRQMKNLLTFYPKKFITWEGGAVAEGCMFFRRL